MDGKSNGRPGVDKQWSEGDDCRVTNTVYADGKAQVLTPRRRYQCTQSQGVRGSGRPVGFDQVVIDRTQRHGLSPFGAPRTAAYIEGHQIKV